MVLLGVDGTGESHLLDMVTQVAIAGQLRPGLTVSATVVAATAPQPASRRPAL